MGGAEGPPQTLSPRPSSKYFEDAAEAALWLREQRQALESSCSRQDPASPEALLLSHLRLERSVRAFAVELRQLDEQAQVAAAQASLTVRGAPEREPDCTAAGPHRTEWEGALGVGVGRTLHPYPQPHLCRGILSVLCDRPLRTTGLVLICPAQS